MAKFRVWAECIHDVYLDVEAETEEEAKEIAEAADGGDFHDDPTSGEWKVGSAYPLEDDDEVDYTYEDMFGERS